MPSVFDRIRGSLTAGAPPAAARRSLAGAARQYHLTGAATSGPAKAELWQESAYQLADQLGELGAAFRLFGNGLSKVRMFPAWRIAFDEDPIPLQDALELEDVGLRPPTSLVADAFANWEALEASEAGLSRQGGVRGLLSEHGNSLGLVGETYLWGHEVDGQEVWEAVSVRELSQRAGRWEVRRSPRQRAGDPVSSDDFLLRIWRPHPAWSDLADSSMRALLDEGELLLLLQAGDMAVARSRIANAGILYVDDTFDFGPADPTGEGEEPSSFVQELIAEASAAIANPSSASATVPMVITGDGPLADRIAHIALPRGLDAANMERAKWAITRLAMGIDLPPELLEGKAGLNHWTAWQVDESTWKAHIEPTVQIVGEAYANGYLRPRTSAAGRWDQDALRRLTVWHDGSGLVQQPDRSEDAHKAYAAFALGTDPYLKAIGFSDEDAPDDEELARRLMMMAAVSSTKRAGQAPDDTTRQMPDGGSAAEVAMLRAAVDLSTRRKSPVDISGPVAALAAAAAPAAVGPLDRLAARLTDADIALMERLQGAADAAARRVLERAGNRIVSSARKDRDMAAAIRDVPTHRIPAVLGRVRVAQLGLSDSDLIADTLGGLRDDFDRAVQAVQRQSVEQALTVLPDDLPGYDPARLQQQQDEDRDAAWGWFAAAMTTHLLSLMFDPSPSAPALGEFDPDAKVPFGLIRESVARAGGGAEGLAGRIVSRGLDAAVDLAGRGVATGVRILQLLAIGGIYEAGLVWRYGATPRQTFPPHLALDGREFSGRDDEVLVNASSFPHAAFYHPGDHRGCRCAWSPVLRSRSVK